MEPIKRYYQNKEYSKIFEVFSSSEHNCVNIKYLLYALFETGNWKEYTKLFELYRTEIESICDTSRLRGYSGLLLFGEGNYTQAKANLQKAVDEAGEYSTSASEWLTTLQLSTFIYKSMGRLNFHFAPELTLEEKNSFADKYLNAYDRITKVFPYNRGKNIDVFVFTGWKDNLGNNLSYANSRLATVHVNHNDDAGHELTHILCKESFSINTAFIDEGVAEYFDDLTRGYKIVMQTSEYTLSDLFTNFRDFDQDFSYLYARIFVSCLFEYYDGDIEAAREILEASTIKQIGNNAAVALSKVATKTQNVFRKMVEIRNKEGYVYVHRDDLYTLKNI